MTQTITSAGVTKLTADDGKVLSNGQTVSTDVHLGILDDVSNWQEIDAPEDERENA